MARTVAPYGILPGKSPATQARVPPRAQTRHRPQRTSPRKHEDNKKNKIKNRPTIGRRRHQATPRHHTHATSANAQPAPSIWFMASGFSLLWTSCHHDVVGCCPLFAVAVGSVSCFMLCVSVSAFCGSGILMACGHCTQACPCVPLRGLFVFSFRMLVMCFFRSACRLACYVCWLCSCCGCFHWFCRVFCWCCFLFSACLLVLSVCCLSAGLLACACFRLFCRVLGFSAFPACCVEFGCPRV